MQKGLPPSCDLKIIIGSHYNIIISDELNYVKYP